jgi:hypothetical protein
MEIIKYGKISLPKDWEKLSVGEYRFLLNYMLNASNCFNNAMKNAMKKPKTKKR